MKFFIPEGNEEGTEKILNLIKENKDKPIYKMEYEHEGSKFILQVGLQRKEYARETGPRGGYIKNARQSKIGRYTGSVVTMILENSSLIRVYSVRGGEWGNPSLVGLDEVLDETVEYFEL